MKTSDLSLKIQHLNSGKSWQRWLRSIRLILIWLLVAMLLTCARLASHGFGPQGDLFIHYYLTNAFAHNLLDGEWLPRWAGLLDGGRGDAVFTFYGFLFYWISGGMTAFWGLNILTVFKCLLFSDFVIAQGSAYLLAREFFGVRAGVIASIAYVVLPAYPHLALHRGFLPNSLALSLMPLALLGAHRLLTGRTRIEGRQRSNGMALFSLSFGAIILIHPITTYLCAVAVVLMVLCYWPQAGWGGLRNLATSVLFALSLTAFFLVPQIMEMKWVRADLAVTHQNYRHYFLFAEAADDTHYRQVWAGLNQVMSLMTLGQTALVALLSLASYRILRQRQQIALWGWWLAISLAGLFISLPASDIFWRYLPGLKFIQFPWRFQPFVALSAGLLAAAAFEGWQKNGKRLRTALAATGTWLILITLALTFLLVRPGAQTLSETEIHQLLHHENGPTLTIQQISALPGGDELVRIAYAANQMPFRPRGAETTQYPPVAQVGGASIIAGRGQLLTQELRNSYRRFSLVNEEAVRVRVETYNYPNWVARIDGQATGILSEQGSGLMLIGVPAGNHILTLNYEVTRPVERWARFVSLFACLALLLTGGRRVLSRASKSTIIG